MNRNWLAPLCGMLRSSWRTPGTSPIAGVFALIRATLLTRVASRWYPSGSDIGSVPESSQRGAMVVDLQRKGLACWFESALTEMSHSDRIGATVQRGV
jgi:hypothetical protein